jgi:predicted nucleic acid-binding Zn ribbon protein
LKEPGAGRGQVNPTLTMDTRYCLCGHQIGVVTAYDPPRFYDQSDWSTPATHCPACDALLTVDKLTYSEEQQEALAKVYAFLLQRRRLRLTQEK